MAPFTPLFDEITERHGLITSAVYGYVWRMCQKERGVCDASFQTMANDLNVSRRTIINHIKLLTKCGMITDLTPTEGHKPHKYLVQEIHQTSELDSPEESITSAGDSLGGELDSPVPVQEIHQTSAGDSPKDTIQEDTRINIIKQRFQDKTGLLPNQYSYGKDWLPVLEKWIEQFGDDTEAMMDEAIDISQGNNENGKRYRLSSPRSLHNIIINCKPKTKPAVVPERMTVPDGKGGKLIYLNGKLNLQATEEYNNGHNKQPTN